MNLAPPTRTWRPRRTTAWVLLGILPILGAGAYLRCTHAAPAPTSSKAPLPKPNRSGYVNRAIITPPPSAAPSEDAPQPTLSGYVYGSDGAALENATVAVSTFQVAGNVPSVIRTAETDARGYFEFPLPEGTYQVHANRAGYGPTVASAHTGDALSLVLRKSGMIKGHVRDAQGQPVRRFALDIVSVTMDNRPAVPPVWSKQIESPDGSFAIDEVPTWPVIVRAIVPDKAPALSKHVRVRSGETAEVELSLTDGCTLEGRAQDEQGKPVAHVFVNAEPRVASGSMSMSLAAMGQVETDEAGMFKIEHVPPGSILVRGYDGSHAVSTASVDVDACDKLAPVQLVMNAGGTIAGVARDSEGTPIPGARLTLSERAVGFVNAVADAEGNFKFEEIPAGNVRLELLHGPQRTAVSFEVTAGALVQRDVTLYPQGSGQIQGRITASGKPLPGVQLYVAANRGREKGLDMYYITTDREGAYRLSVPEGNYLVSVVSAATAEGVAVEKDKVATLDLDVEPTTRPTSQQQ
jgi:hypothetical protein